MAHLSVLQPLLYQNNDRSVTLIDVPTSITAAQGTRDPPSCHTLLSAEPQQRPYETNDPKTTKARAKVSGNTVNTELETTYEKIIQSALAEIRSAHVGNWCYSRKLMPPAERRPKKRKLDSGESHGNTRVSETATGRHEQTSDLEPEKMSSLLQSLASNENGLVDVFTVSCRPHKDPGRKESTISDDASDYDEQTWDPVQENAHQSTIELTIKQSSTSNDVPAGHTFYIPPECTFILGNCNEPTTLRTEVRDAAQENSKSRRFDFILLDPPWPNASVKRQRSYSTGFSLRNMKQLIVGMDLDTLVAPSGLVGMWITNKPAVRSLVLGPGGLFESLNVGLIEEWIWVKTTTDGQPVTALNGLWRKPYEVLLLARAPQDPLQVATEATKIKRRVVVGVPDIHSRKPCLKSLIELHIPDRNNYKALEIFARHLVAGWWSWGNEVLKFNWEGYWMHELPESVE